MEDIKRNLLVSTPRKQLGMKQRWKYHGLGEDGISLGLAEIDFAAPEPVKKALIDAIMNDDYHYAPLEGLPEFRQAVVDKMQRLHQVHIDAENVMPTVGVMNGIWLASRAILKPGDEALVLTPTYPPIFGNIATTGAKVVSVPPLREGYHPDLDEVVARISAQTRMIAICNPNNPTGAVYSKDELEALADIAKRRKIYIFSDELYDMLTFDGRRHVSLASLSGTEDLAITVSGFTKVHGMSGLRIGYVISDKEIIRKMRDLNHPILIHPNTLGQKAAVAALNDCDDWLSSFRSHCEKMRNILCDALDGLEGVSCPRPEGAFFAFPGISKICGDDKEAALALEKKYRVRVAAGSGFGQGGEGHLRLNFATTLEIVQEAISRLSEAFVSRVV